MTLKKKNGRKEEEKEYELVEFNQEQDFCAEVQIKLLKAKFDEKNKVTYDWSNTFLRFSVSNCAALSKKYCSSIANILDETYCLFDLEKLGLSDNYTIEIKKCCIDKSIYQTNFIYIHPGRNFWAFCHCGNFSSPCLRLACVIRLFRKKMSKNVFQIVIDLCQDFQQNKEEENENIYVILMFLMVK